MRDWLYVDDHARALIAAFERGVPGETYNVGCHGERRNIEMVESICALLDELSPHPTIRGPPLAHHLRRRPAGTRPPLRHRHEQDRTRAAAGRASESVESGLRKTVQWYVDNQAWCERVQAGAYRGERLGLGAAT